VIQTVQQTVATRFPRLRGKRVLVAASGGADSTALALALQEMGCEIALAHVHHGIRGKEATADVRFVRALAKKRQVPFFSGKFNVPAEAQKSGDSLEMAARRLRREFLRTTAKAEGFRFIATGHTADDQAETVLMRIVRGTSITGLAGISYSAKRGGLTTIRPLRDVTRKQVIAYLNQHKQTWREDASNADDFAMRNRVRHELLPLLEKRLNPSVRKALLRLADIAAAEDEVMAGLVKKAKPSAKEPLAIRRRCALVQLRKQGVPEAAIGFDAVEQTFHTVETFLPCHGKIAKSFSMVWKNTAPRGLVPRVNQAEPAVRAGGRPRSPATQGGRGPQLIIRRGVGFSRRTDEVCLSAAAVAGRDLVFRSWQAGDRMKPLGMTGSKKLSDIFTDLKVPRAERKARIVVECDGEIAALAGWRVSRDFAVQSPRAASIRIQLQAITPRSRSS
jgi:tRNA(Ile)-lysidine synthase